MGVDEKKKGAASDHQQYPHPPEYGTFQGVANYPPPPPPHQPPPPPPPTGFPQPVPPPGAADPPAPHPQYYTQGYQTVQGYAVAEGRPVRERRLPCCGIGCGWFLFIIGFVLATIPWYIGALIMLCARIDHREKPGYIACVVGAVLATIAIILGATKGGNAW
ncbi:PREDICTED: 60S ribosomal protein L18a-like protein [Prunus mume]|uniref:60S ribosomal protein L18a-like protein n=1 Tax=Prunus mume TaxID=102107 RepID=A0ABM0NKP0_PRUMU|nr:PREDICTED: 60S ribosomal protein L18a-like protein [Prunus mume]